MNVTCLDIIGKSAIFDVENFTASGYRSELFDEMSKKQGNFLDPA